MAERRKYTAREIAAMTNEQWSELPEGGLFIKFDDGQVVKCKTFKTVYVAPFWEFIVKHGGQITQSNSMCRTIDGEYSEMVYNTSTHLLMSENAFWETFWAGEECPDRFWKMSEDIYHASNRIHNYSALYDERYMDTSWAEDGMRIIFHPKIQEYKKQAVEGIITTDECHNLCYDVLVNDVEYFKGCSSHYLARCGLLSKIQAKQQIGPRGNVPDINSEAHPHEIEAGYYERLSYAYDSIIEARTASIALYMQGGPLEDSEYNNRLCQLMCGYIRRVEYRDCGSKDAMNVLIQDKNILKLLKGKNIILDDGSNYRMRGNEDKLIGTKVRVRGAPTCHEKEQGVVCSKCLGQAAFVVPPKSSPGHILIIDPLGQISQTILSTKHVLANVVSLSLNIDIDSARYIKLHDDNKFVVMMTDAVDKKHLKLRIPHEYAAYLSDLDELEPSKINITAISDIHEMVISEYEDGINKLNTICDTSVSGVGACFTPEALYYIKHTGWNIVNGMIEVDLKGWNIEDPLLVTKRVSHNVTETLRQFKGFIAPKKDKKKRVGKSIVDCATPEEAIDELYNILSPKLKVNYVQLEMFVTALMSSVEGYRMPHGQEDFRFITMNDALVNRSALVALGYQAQYRYMTDPETYCKKEEDIPPHPMDGYFAKGTGFTKYKSKPVDA